MMKIAIDLDGAAFAFPDTFTTLAWILKIGGAELIFLTAATGELPAAERHCEVTQRIARYLPKMPSILVFRVEEPDVGEWLTSKNVNLVASDKKILGRPCKKLSPWKQAFPAEKYFTFSKRSLRT